MRPSSRHLCSQEAWNWSAARGGIIPGILTPLYATRKGEVLETSAGTADRHRRFCDLITASSVGGMVEDDGDSVAHVAGLDVSVTDFGALIGPDYSFIVVDARIDFDAYIDVDAPVIDHDRDLKSIVGGLLNSSPSASLGRLPPAD